ncbi:hypothetical protein GCM10009720_09510 [Yaniella flava]|uniref:Uncharacterized protein n=1 Tax=Yaniella flava TaxID=287930 RepID=A0ABN2U8V6_9MICC|nr:hypothetical protein [Micrococcaceae bacterium]
MTIRELLETLSQIPEDQLDQQIYVCDWCPECDDNLADNLEVNSVSPYADDEPPSQDNPLGINYCARGAGCSGGTTQR